LATILNHQALNNNSHYDNDNEEIVVEEPIENVVLLLSKFPAVDFVEHLHEHERVEQNCEVFDLVFVGDHYIVHHLIERSVSFVIVTKDLSAAEKNGDEDDDLEEGLTNDVTPHDWGNNTFQAGMGWALEEVISGTFSSKGKSSTGVHDKVYPKHLN